MKKSLPTFESLERRCFRGKGRLARHEDTEHPAGCPIEERRRQAALPAKTLYPHYLSGLPPVFFAIALIICLSLNLSAAEVTVFAAASLTDSLKQVAAHYEQSSGDKIIFNFAASGTLALQIENGAPADIFFSADKARMDTLAKKGLLASETRQDLLGNSLVIVTFPGGVEIHSPGELTNSIIQRIALGDAKTVPAGSYAKTYLEQLGLWSAIQPKVIPCENVRAVLAAVESGNVDAGVVYKTDSLISKKLKIAFAVPENEGPKIVYPVALINHSTQPEAARRFLAYLNSAASTSVFASAGFNVLQKAK